MKHIHLNIAAVISIALFAVLTQTIYSAGTPAGTVIQSRSKVVYSTASGATTDTVYSNYVSFTVAQVASVNITPSSNSTTTSSDSVFVDYAITVTNSGNGTDQFNLSSTSTKGWTRAFYFDTNGDDVLQGSEVTAGAITQTANIAADGTYKLFVRVFVPRGGSLNGQIDTTVVTATSVFDDSKTNTAQARTTVNTANFSGIGEGFGVSPTNPQPGDNVTYSLTLTNTGTVAATGVSFSDFFNASQFSFVSATTSTGTVNTSGNPVLWSIGTINPGGSVTVTIILQVSPSLVNGTVLNNTISATYTVGGNTFTVSSNNPYAAVGVVRGVQVSPTSFSAIKEAEDTLAYAMTVKNTGNAKDVLELSYNSSQSYTWTFYNDVNENGILDAGDTQLTNTNSDHGVDVDSVAAADSVKILARLIVPVVSTDQTQDVTTFTVKSSVDQNKFQSAIGTTTINSADIELTRTVLPSGNQPPGTEMTFTITYQNIGNGKAYNVVLTENEADNMTYVANSVIINEASKTDVSDGDNVTVTTVSEKKIITINLGTINGLFSGGTITYKATIN